MCLSRVSSVAPATPNVAPNPQPAMSRPLWDPLAEKQASPYYQLEAYLELKPQREVDNPFEMPALLANGRCADPVGEGR